jgi:hypothetical protein
MTKIIREMDDDTLFVAMADHGTNEHGNHYNCDIDWHCDAWIFAYTKRGFAKNNIEKYPDIMFQNHNTNEHIVAPTLAILGGL